MELQIWHLFKLFNTGLKELTIRVYTRRHNKVTHAFVASTYLWIQEWIAKGFFPQNVNSVNAGFGSEYSSLVSELLRVWLILNWSSPAGRTGFLKY